MRYQLMQQIVFSFGLAMLVGAVASADEPVNPPTISVTGNAEIKVKPDQAVFSFSIQGREKTLDEAVATNDQAIAKVMQFLQTAGVKDKDVRTEVVRIQPIYRPTKRSNFVPQPFAQGLMPVQPLATPPPPGKGEDPLKPIGYEARRGMSVTVNNLDDLEKIYTGLLKNGVNQVGGISFQTTELRKHRDEARLKAIRAAREKGRGVGGRVGGKTGRRSENYRVGLGTATQHVSKLSQPRHTISCSWRQLDNTGSHRHYGFGERCFPARRPQVLMLSPTKNLGFSLASSWADENVLGYVFVTYGHSGRSLWRLPSLTTSRQAAATEPLNI